MVERQGLRPAGDGQRWVHVRLVQLDDDGHSTGPTYRTLTRSDGTFGFHGLVHATYRLEIDTLNERVPFKSWPKRDNGRRTAPERSRLFLPEPLR